MIKVSVGDGWAQAIFTDRADGDMGHGGVHVDEVSAEVAARRHQVLDLPWTWLRQVHGNEVVEVCEPGGGAGTAADAAVTNRAGCALAILTADCAPVALASPEGVTGAVHAGWAGAAAGILGRAVAEMHGLGATSISAVIGPTIHAECYEFGDADLRALETLLGPEVRSCTSGGAPALDLPTTVRLALRAAGVDSVTVVGGCTGCDPNRFSWRIRGDNERQAMVVWR